MDGERSGEDTPTRTSNLRPPWQPGQSGNPNGRPKGARSKLGEAFIDALKEDWEQHGIKAIQDMRHKHPGDYVKVVAGLLPKEVSGPDGEAIQIGTVERRIVDPQN